MFSDMYVGNRLSSGCCAQKPVPSPLASAKPIPRYNQFWRPNVDMLRAPSHVELVPFPRNLEGSHALSIRDKIVVPVLEYSNPKFKRSGSGTNGRYQVIMRSGVAPFP